MQEEAANSEACARHLGGGTSRVVVCAGLPVRKTRHSCCTQKENEPLQPRVSASTHSTAESESEQTQAKQRREK